MDTDLKARPSVVQKILQKPSPRLEPEVEEARDPLKQARPSIPTPMLDVVLKDGRIRSFSYAYLRQVDYDPGDTLTLRFADEATVRVEGRNLQRHQQQIRLHRADEICEGTEAQGMVTPDSEPHISRIEILTEEEENHDAGKRKVAVR